MHSGAIPNLIPFPGGPPREFLRALAQRIRAALEADGAAIALSRGGEIVCEASIGVAPAVGAKLDATSTLSARCLRTQVPIVHSEQPGRNGAAADSFLLVPVLQDGQAIGICIAFAARENAFTSAHVAWLMKTAESVAAPRVIAPPPAAEPPSEEIPEVEALEREAVSNIAAPEPEPAKPEVPVPPTTLDAETLRGLEEDIAQFERDEKRRARIRLVLKGAAVAVLLCALVIAFIPDRVAAWINPIVQRLEHKNMDRQSPRKQRVTPEQGAR